MAVHLPDDLEEEDERLAREFFAQYDEYDIIPDGAMDEYYEKHASKKLKRTLKAIKEFWDSHPGLR